jgi:formylglycine-generating enzyme
VASVGFTLLALASLVASSRSDLIDSALGDWLDAPPAPAASVWVDVPAGTYRPLFPASAEEKEVAIAGFRIQKTPVTNAQYLAFVSEHPEWRRDRVSRLFADPRYLSHWDGHATLGAADPGLPVVNVSWFAARAYCDAHSARLATEAEWEYVAAASERRADGRKDAAWSARILRWYAAPSRGPGQAVGRQPPNFYGVQDLHGLMWEWVIDFDANLVIGDSRSAGEEDRATFCGGGALRSARPEDYASFMRSAFRSALQAKYVVKHLGFRCARDGKESSS